MHSDSPYETEVGDDVSPWSACLLPVSAYSDLPIQTDLIPVRTSSDTHEGTNDNSLRRQLKAIAGDAVGTYLLEPKSGLPD